MKSRLLRTTLTLMFGASGLMLAACNDDGTIVEREPNIVIDDDSIDFGDVQVGTTVTRNILIRNDGDFPLSLTSVSRAEPFDESYDFEINQMSVVPGGAAQISIAFAPDVLGEKFARIRIQSNDPDEPVRELDIKGTGVTSSLVVDPQTVSFGNVVINTKKTVAVTLSNNSDVDARIEYRDSDSNNVRVCSGPADASVFCISLRDRQIGPDGTFELRAGESTTIDAQFAPTVVNSTERGNFTLSACDAADCKVTVSLDGTGIEQAFQCSPPEVDFGQVNPGSCTTQTVSCENVANEPVTVVDWGTGAASSDEFETSPAQVQVLTEGQSVDVDVTYCPQALGDDEGTLEIETDNPNPRLKFVTVDLIGTGGGPDIDVLPLQVNFGLVSLIAPARRTISIQNVGFTPLEVREIVVDTAGTGAFTAPGAAGGLLEPGEFLDITVEFQPVVEGAVESTLLIRSNDQDEPEVEVRVLGEGINLPPCQFQVSPAQLPFGVVERGRNLSRAFEIQNTGANDCLVTSARIVPGSDLEFSLPDGDINSLIIPPSSAATVRVQYSPDQLGDNTGQIEFSISSNTSPFNTVPLSGTGADASLLIVPNDLDFGTIGVGCAARAREVLVYNTGSSPATIESLNITGNTTAFEIVSYPTPLPAMPLTLAPGAQARFEVGFRADTLSSFAGAVEISGMFGGSPVTFIVSLQGAGSLDATQIDNFEQLGKPKVDILFVIDHTGSMGQEQAALATNFQAFIQFAIAQGLDYQLGVTTTDTNDEGGRLVHSAGTNAFGGAPSNKIVTQATLPSPEAVFADNVAARNLTGGGAADEAGFQAAYLALTSPVLFGHNAGFLRQDAVLSIVFVSDEPEQSPQGADFYINFFLSIKGFRNTNLFSASAVVGDTPGGCSGAGGNATAAPRYLEAVNRTGGVFQSICTNDWSRALEDLSTTAFGFKSRFFLTNQPVISTIEVYVDEVLLPNVSAGGTVNWSYDFGTNAVNFSPVATPEPGGLIRVEYTAECL